jgi:Glycine zipper
MNRPILTLLSASILCVAHTPASADRIYVYPRLGQSDTQQEEDRYQCHLWARGATGFDPMALKGAYQPEYVRVPVPENSKAGATGKGIVGGAIAGAAIGEIDSDRPGRGAAIGAVVGAIVGSVIEHDGEHESHRQAEEQAEIVRQDRRELAIAKANYRSALSACLEGKGYSVN